MIFAKETFEKALAGLTLGALIFAWALPAGATEPLNFKVDNSRDLVVLCTTPEDDPLHEAAVHFCHGYLVGAYHYHLSATAGPGRKPMTCMSDPAPSRNQAITEFIAWVVDNPQYMEEEAVDTMLRWLIIRFPCEG